VQGADGAANVERERTVGRQGPRVVRRGHRRVGGMSPPCLPGDACAGQAATSPDQFLGCRSGWARVGPEKNGGKSWIHCDLG
jgi:hypothetical protein